MHIMAGLPTTSPVPSWCFPLQSAHTGSSVSAQHMVPPAALAVWLCVSSVSAVGPPAVLLNMDSSSLALPAVLPLGIAGLLLDLAASISLHLLLFQELHGPLP